MADLALRRGPVAVAADASASVEAGEIGGYAFTPMAFAVLIEAFLERGEPEQAAAALEERGIGRRLPRDIMATLLPAPKSN